MADSTDDDTLRAIFQQVRSFAVVGFSANPSRPSHYVSQFLQGKGYRIVPVNPGLAGQTMLGEAVHADLAAIPGDVDALDIFRRSEHVFPIVEDALARFPHLKAIWMQLGVRDDAAADLARARGVRVVQDRCPKIEIPRLFGSARPF